jgi:hypothetical protein
MPQLIDNPVGGSEFIGNQMQRFGMVSPNRNALAEGLAGFLPTSPTTSAKAVAAIGAGGMVPGMDLAATVFHGSPHKFEKFDSSKIGTGEGAQAYGHGLYLAESPEVAKSYRESLTNLYGTPTTIDGGGKSVPIPLWLADKIKQGGSVDTAISEWTQRAAESRAAMKTSLQPWIQEGNAVRFESELENLLAIKAAGGGKVADAGSLYKVDLPDEAIAKMLDWNKPLSADAPKEVKDAFNSVIAKYPELKDKFYQAFRDKQPGSHYYSLLNDYAKTGNLVKNQAFAADAMRQAGIPGIRYLDQGSRGQGQGSSNYVVFPGNENMLRILERNGQPMPAPANALAPKKSAPVETPADYGGEHRPPGPDSGAPLHDLTGGGNVYPDDVYGANAAQYYGHGTPAMDRETVRILQGLKDKPNSTVTIYRAVPREAPPSEQAAVLQAQMKKFMARGTVPEGESAKGWYDRASDKLDRLKTMSDPAESMNTINSGDWVTVNRNYAKEHGEGALNGKYKIISQKVKANEVFTNGDSIHEAGYWKGGKAPK